MQEKLQYLNNQCHCKYDVRVKGFFRVMGLLCGLDRQTPLWFTLTEKPNFPNTGYTTNKELVIKSCGLLACLEV